jgi:hypothetical protein
MWEFLATKVTEQAAGHLAIDSRGLARYTYGYRGSLQGGGR